MTSPSLPPLSRRRSLARRVAYLVIDPAHITFLTASLLKPPVVREVVHFYDGSCVLDAAARDSAAYNRSVAQMHEQIRRALQVIAPATLNRARILPWPKAP